MRNLVFSPPAFAFVVGTRVALGFGLGLLLSSRIPENRRRTIGMTLLALGASTTIPSLRLVRGQLQGGRSPGASGVDPRLIGAERFPRKGDDW